ncbi:hypothetical protein ACFL6A_00015 [bacterium]
MRKITLSLTILFTSLLFLIHSGLTQEKKTTTWEAIGPEGGIVQVLVQHPTNSDIYYVSPMASPYVIHRTTDNGNTWHPLSELPLCAYAIAIDPDNPSTLYAATTGRIYKSTDGGVNWTRYDVPSQGGRLHDIQVDPSNSSIVHTSGFAWDGSFNVFSYFRSTDSGMNWTVYHIGTGSGGNATTLGVDPGDSDVIYLGGFSNSNDLIMKSIDGGDTWTDITGSTDGMPYTFWINPSSTNKVYVLTGNGVYRSTNGGSTWTKNSGGYVGGYQLEVDPSNFNVMYVGTYGIIYKSIDGGIHWSSYTNGLAGEGCGGICVNQTNTNQILFANSLGVYKSIDGGINWTESNSGLLYEKVIALSLAPSDTKILFAALWENGLIKTANAAAKAVNPNEVSWERLPVFYYCSNLEDLKIDPSDPDRILALEGGQ